MYIYFESIGKVLTCEEYPQVLSIDIMKAKKLEYMCNKWQKNILDNGNFTLSYKYKKETCNCDNSSYTCLDDYDNYECYNCGRYKSKEYEEDTNLYLQNSGSIDIVWTKPYPSFCELCEVNEFPNIYKWINDTDKAIFALHIKNDMLSDDNIINEISNMKKLCHIKFNEYI